MQILLVGANAGDRLGDGGMTGGGLVEGVWWIGCLVWSASCELLLSLLTRDLVGRIGVSEARPSFKISSFNAFEPSGLGGKVHRGMEVSDKGADTR